MPIGMLVFLQQQVRVWQSVAAEESGFTLIELLVVILILGVLSAIALPAFFDQSEKSDDAKAKDSAHAIQVAMESCAVENDASYEGCKKANLLKLEPSLRGVPTFSAAPTEENDGYKIVVTAETTGDHFEIKRSKTGALTFPCSPKASGGCPATKTWGDG